MGKKVLLSFPAPTIDPWIRRSESTSSTAASPPAWARWRRSKVPCRSLSRRTSSCKSQCRRFCLLACRFVQRRHNFHFGDCNSLLRICNKCIQFENTHKQTNNYRSLVEQIFKQALNASVLCSFTGRPRCLVYKKRLNNAPPLLKQLSADNGPLRQCTS